MVEGIEVPSVDVKIAIEHGSEEGDVQEQGQLGQDSLQTVAVSNDETSETAKSLEQGTDLNTEESASTNDGPCDEDEENVTKGIDAKILSENDTADADGRDEQQGTAVQNNDDDNIETKVNVVIDDDQVAAEGSSTRVAPIGDPRLQRMGLLTALAIGIHNFPEGLATFVATLADPRIGASLAIAIAIHNIPEGLCVSIPVYYATNNRLKAVGWALLSGISEPLGALLGYLALRDSMSPITFGIVFGLVGGMMIYICFRELVPTAHRYDPQDSVTTPSIVAGMATMALSLVLFVSGPSDDSPASSSAVNVTRL